MLVGACTFQGLMCISSLTVRYSPSCIPGLLEQLESIKVKFYLNLTLFFVCSDLKIVLLLHAKSGHV